MIFVSSGGTSLGGSLARREARLHSSARGAAASVPGRHIDVREVTRCLAPGEQRAGCFSSQHAACTEVRRESLLRIGSELKCSEVATRRRDWLQRDAACVMSL